MSVAIVNTNFNALTPVQQQKCKAARIEYMFNQIRFHIDAQVAALLNEILHHDKFKALEASWRGLSGLTEIASEPVRDITFNSLNQIKVLFIELSWHELGRHLNSVNDIEQSHLFKLVYSKGLDTPGETPFSILLGDYRIKNGFNRSNGVHDLDCLRDISSVCEMAMCPFITSLNSQVFDIGQAEDINLSSSTLEKRFQSTHFKDWQRLRKLSEARFIGITYPDILLRKHYSKNKNKHGFNFTESENDTDSDFLWGNSAYAYVANLMKTFVRTGWFVNLTRGIREYQNDNDHDSPIDTRLYVHPAFEFDSMALAPRPATRVQLDDMSERELSQLGIIPLYSRHSDYECRFYHSPSFYEPAEYETTLATSNAQLSAWLPYTLGAARIAHHIKVMVRHKIGGFVTEAELKVAIAKYLNEYTTRDTDGISLLRLKKPLANYAIDINPLYGEVGQFIGIIRLQPHGQCDQIISSIKLIAKMTLSLQNK